MRLQRDDDGAAAVLQARIPGFRFDHGRHVGLLAIRRGVVGAVAFGAGNGWHREVLAAAAPGRLFVSRAANAAILAYGFDELGAHRLTAVTAEANAPANAALHRLGWEREAVLRNAAPGGGDLLVWAAFRDGGGAHAGLVRQGRGS